MNKKDILKKWALILNNIGVTGSESGWMNANKPFNNTLTEENKTFGDFLFPVAIKSVAMTIGIDLVSVQPLAYTNIIYKNKIRSKKIKKIIENIIV